MIDVDVVLSCDGCQQSLSATSLGAVRRCAQRLGWMLRRNGQHYCTDCRRDAARLAS